MSQENVNLVRRSWEAWERGDMDAIFAFYDHDIVWDQSRYERFPASGVYQGHEGVKHFFREWLGPFESYHAHVEEFIDAGDSVVTRVRQGGRGKGSGAEVEMPVYWQVYQLRGGRAIRIEVYSAESDALEAVGLSE